MLFPRLAHVVAEDPRVLRAAALRAVDDERALAQRHAREAARQHLDPLAVEHERAQVDVPALHAVVAKARMAGDGERRLGDVVARVRPYTLPILLDLFPRGGGADEHA